MSRYKKKETEKPLLQLYDDILPPNEKEIELIVLGTLLMDNEVIYKVASELKPELFYSNDSKSVCTCIIHLYNQNKPIDILTVTQTSKELNFLETASPYFISSLTNRVSSSSNFDIHFKILQQYALRRNMIQACGKGIRESYNNQKDVFDLISEIQIDVDKALKGIVTYQVSSVGAIHDSIIKKSIELIDSEKKSGVPTGLDLLDNVTNGWQDSDLIILAGRPSMGKTAAAISMALYPAIREEIGIGIFSLEMSDSQLTSRMQSILSGVNVGKIVKKQLNVDDITRIDALAKDLKKAPIYIDDTPNISVQEFKGKARKMVKELGCRLILVDYLQLMRSGMKTQSREQEIAEISKALKAVAKELRVPVIALSQLSRAVESRGGDKKPMLSDLRESGQIEQDADMVCFCYRPEYYDIQEYEVGNQHFDTHGLFLLLVAKNRNGEIGEIPLKFIHEQTKLTNYDSNFSYQEPQKQLAPSSDFEEKSSTFVQQVSEETEVKKDSVWGNDIFDLSKDEFEDENPF